MTQRASLDLPAYGLGAAGLGNLYTAISDEEAQATLEAAIVAQLNLFDTAPYYGHGLSEQRIGAYLASSEFQPVISTKVGRMLEPAGSKDIPDNGFESPAPFIPKFDYSAKGIREAFAGSQQRLGVEAVDILLLHDIGEMVHGPAHGAMLALALEEALPEMAAMKAEAKTKWIGLGVNEIDVCRQVLEHVDLDVLLIAGRYTLLEHADSLSFLDECHRNGVKVIIGGAFNSGLLASTGEEPLHYDYVQAPQWAVERTGQLRAVCETFNTPLPAVALQFCGSHPAVACVIPGAKSAAQVRQIADWTQMEIDPGLWDALKDRDLISRDSPVC
ncbi:aldo/keto reductase [Hyphomonas sp.]|uniref:aldo/keto reductase n=1 Tax=Hyphomonas sp. TaxID=87 RepID=UPI0030F90F87